MDMTDAAVLYLVCSDRMYSGKTLLARMLVDWLLLKDAGPQVIDLDAPAHPLAGLYPDMGLKVDFDHTLGRVELFDGIVSQPDVHRVLELPVLHMEAFLREAGNLEFFEAVVAAGGHVALLHLLDPSPAFVDRARRLTESLPRGAYYYLVRRAGPDDAAEGTETAAVREELKCDGEIQVPRLSAEALTFFEKPDFSLAALMNGDIAASEPVLRYELHHLAQTMFAQFNRIALQMEIEAFRDSGVV